MIIYFNLQTKQLSSWVAEACEPFFFSQDPQTVKYKILTEQELKDESEDIGNMQRKVKYIQRCFKMLFS